MDILKEIKEAAVSGKRLFGVLIDPDKMTIEGLDAFLRKLKNLNNFPTVTHLLIGGSTVENNVTQRLVAALKEKTNLPLVLFPGDYSQICESAHALLFLQLLSGNNPEYLIGQQRKAAPVLIGSTFEVIPTAYLLIDGHHISAVARVTQTTAMSQTNNEAIVHTAYAAQLMGNQLLYLEAGSGATQPVKPKIIEEVNKVTNIPIIVGGGLKSKKAINTAYNAGATMVVVGTALEG